MKCTRNRPSELKKDLLRLELVDLIDMRQSWSSLRCAEKSDAGTFS